MGKFDGMDPKLVRDLLTEVKRAAGEMRTIEGRVTQVMSAAGLATRATHRPGQVAEAVEDMSKDVTGRLALLEKREDAPKGADAGKEPVPGAGADGKPESKDDGKDGKVDGKPADDKPVVKTEPKDGGETLDDPKDKREDDRSRYDNPRAGDPQSDAKTDEPKPDKPDAKVDEPKPDKPDAKVDEPKPDKPDAKVDELKPDKPDAKVDELKPDKPDVKVDEPKPDKPDVKTGDDKPDVPDTKVGDDVTASDENKNDKKDDPVKGDEPKDEERDSRRDRGAEAPLDPTKPQVVEVDGVKVLQVPLDPPTAEELEELIRNIDDVRPQDTPATPADTTPGQLQPGGKVVDAGGLATSSGDVTGCEAKPPDPAAVQTLVENVRDVQPMEMPGVEVPKGEYGTGEWAPQNIKPDGPPGTVQPGTQTTAAYGEPTGQPAATQTTTAYGEPAGTQTTAAYGEPTGAQTAPAGQTPSGAQTAPAAQAPSAEPTGQPDQRAGDRTGIENSTPAAAGNAGLQQGADDGGDVVSRDAEPFDPAVLKTLIENARDVQPMEMPGVEVPEGAWGKGEWVPEDIGPDGPAGSVEPGSAEPGERSS
ncbi:hypothetical protein [Nonomuraea typhae]|uniref:Uncharacterized protein n=1 Tax=Nonomuraea typhae TaxID=2603600 RepID=A0ABW7YZC1_9ACTN